MPDIRTNPDREDIQQARDQDRKEKTRHSGGVSPEDKKLINLGVYHSMKKFDDIETWLINSSIDTYIKILQEETRKHYMEEKPVGDKVEDEVIAFINATVVQIVNRFLTH